MMLRRLGVVVLLVACMGVVSSSPVQAQAVCTTTYGNTGVILVGTSSWNLTTCSGYTGPFPVNVVFDIQATAPTWSLIIRDTGIIWSGSNTTLGYPYSTSVTLSLSKANGIFGSGTSNHVTVSYHSPAPSTPTPTNTPILPTATNTPLPTATNTPSPTATNTPLPTATNTPTPAAMFLPITGYEYTYSFEPRPGLQPVVVDDYWTAYLLANWFLPLFSVSAVTTTEGYFVPDISCNVGPVGGTVCQTFDGDKVISPTKLIDLCPSAAIVQSYVLALEPLCNGSQFRNASLNNFATDTLVRCTSASPNCWLTSYDLDELALVVDLDNNATGADYQLKIYPLQGGSDDFMVLGLATILTCFFSVFVNSKKVETFGRGLMFMLMFIPYFMVGGSVTQASRLYYFYLYFELAFTALDFARYKLFFANRR